MGSEEFNQHTSLYYLLCVPQINKRRGWRDEEEYDGGIGVISEGINLLKESNFMYWNFSKGAKEL